MAWKNLRPQGTAIDIKQSINEPYEGVYTGKEVVQTRIGPQNIWKFTNENEETFGIYGFTNLDREMDHVKVGDTLQITYLGTKNVKTKYGMKDVHQVSVARWEPDAGESDIPL